MLCGVFVCVLLVMCVCLCVCRFFLVVGLLCVMWYDMLSVLFYVCVFRCFEVFACFFSFAVHCAMLSCLFLLCVVWLYVA